MRTYTTTQINPASLTFNELKQMVSRTTGKPIPEVEQIAGDNEDILFIQECGCIDLIVYTNGFYLCRCGDNATVYAVDRCRNILFKNPLGVMMRLSEQEFRNGPCLLPLVIAACNAMDCAEELNTWIADYAAFLEEEFQCEL